MGGVGVELACSELPEGFRTLRAQGSEGMNALSRWDVGVLLQDASFDPEPVIGATAVLNVIDEIEGSARAIGLVVTDVAHEGEGRDGHHFTVTLASFLWFLTLRSGFRIFLDKNTKEIVEEVLKSAGVPASAVTWRLSGEYVKRPQTVQYGETEWAFVTRLLADDGISLWFDDVDGQGPVVVIGDDPGSHDTILGNATLPYEDPGSPIQVRAFHELSFTKEIAPTAVLVRDHDIRAPDVPIEGAAGEGAFEHFEYPACVQTKDAAAKRAATRLEQLRRHERHMAGATACVRLQPGRVVKVAGCSDDWMNAPLLVTAAEHHADNGARADATASSYGCRVKLVPAGETAHRPDLPRDAPRAAGVEAAVTTGPAGDEIHVDDLGRVKVRFPWDRSGITDDKSSYWVRAMQQNLGASMLLPRVGWEVPVAYVDGNPDRPFVLARMYDGSAIVPYGLPGAAATTTLQSATSPGGGTTNEIRMGDTGGGQEMFVHATKDQSVTVGGSATSTVSANETHDVNLAYQMAIGGAQSLTVGASQSVNIGTMYVNTIKGSRSEMIGGMENVKVTANRVVAVKGAYSEMVGALYGIQCNQANYTIKGSFTQLIGGSMSLKSGLGTSQSVLAARTELVGGSRTINGRSGMGESVTGAKSLTAGANSEKPDADWIVQVKGAGAVNVGGGAKLTADGSFTVEAPEISLTIAGTIKAEALKIGGGKLTAKSGTTHVKGAIKRTGGTNIG